MCKRECALSKSERSNRTAFTSKERKVSFFFLAILLLISSVFYPVQGWSQEQIIVNIHVNGVPKGDFFILRDSQGELFVNRNDFSQLGIDLPENAVSVEMEQDRYVALSSLSQFKTEFDEKQLVLFIMSPVELLPRTNIDLSAKKIGLKDAYTPRENSFFLNYALNYSYFDYSYDTLPEGNDQFMLVNKFGSRSGNFFFITDTQYTKNDLTSDFLRLMSYVTYERPHHLQWITLGDMFAISGNLGSTINIGGLGISKVYRMDPYLIRQPTLDFSGAAALPSQVDIYVDGILSGRQNIQPGQFDIRNLNYYGGTRDVELVIRDAFGIEQRFLYSVYFARTLLKHQLHEYSYNIGWLRDQYGTKSNEYDKLAFSAFHRYGATDWLTIGASAEAADDIYNASIQTTFLMPWTAGVVTLELAGSENAENTGWAGSVSHSYQSRKFGSSAVFTKYSHDYSTIASGSSPANMDYVAGISASYYMSRWGSFSLGYSQQKAYDFGERKTASASYSYNLTRLLTLGIITQAIKTGNNDTDYQLYISLNYHSPTGFRAYAQHQSTDDGNSQKIQISKDQPIGEGWGGNILASRAERTAADTTYIVNPRAQYNARHLTYTWDSYFQDSDDVRQNVHRAGLAGSLVYAGGFWGMSRPVNDSFAFVRVDRLADVPVTINGQVVGETDREGLLIIPTLRSYNVNDISMKANDIPMEYSISGLNRKIFPPVWSGSCIALEAQKLSAVTGTLFMKKDGKKIQLEYVEIAMKVGEKELLSPTGKGGEFYLENSFGEDDAAAAETVVDKQSCNAIAQMIKAGGSTIPPGTYKARVEYNGGECGFAVTFPETEEVITELGEIECVASAGSPQQAKKKILLLRGKPLLRRL
ncbi:MAG: Fimbrial Usher protein [Deltaproteobacteria bacterium ADurb.Bin022]|nr:MAG: Fimbrial Usher protein [Deltaproteobacteria bacterium ADurb.Bin022]